MGWCPTKQGSFNFKREAASTRIVQDVCRLWFLFGQGVEATTDSLALFPRGD